MEVYILAIKMHANYMINIGVKFFQYFKMARAVAMYLVTSYYRYLNAILVTLRTSSLITRTNLQFFIQTWNSLLKCYTKLKSNFKKNSKNLKYRCYIFISIKYWRKNNIITFRDFLTFFTKLSTNFDFID